MLSWDQVVKALENEKYSWRTVRGVAKEIKATESEVLRLINQHASEVIKLSVSAETGEDLYTTRRHYRETAPYIDKIASSVTSNVASTSGSSLVKKGWGDKDE
jgi:hypothetical protein